jgi:hypothetical protein
MSVTLAPEFKPTVTPRPAEVIVESPTPAAEPRRVIHATFEPYGELPANVEVRHAKASRTRRVQSVLGSIVAHSFLFAVVTFLVFFVSTLTAQVQVEHARQAQVRAVQSAQRAGVSAQASHQRTWIANADAINRPAPSGVIADSAPYSGDRVLAQR